METNKDQAAATPSPADAIRTALQGAMVGAWGRENALRALAELEAENQRLRNYVAVIASGIPREDLIAIEREFGEPVDGRLPS